MGEVNIKAGFRESVSGGNPTSAQILNGPRSRPPKVYKMQRVGWVGDATVIRAQDIKNLCLHE